jgi:hypothetical protein
MAYSGEVLAIVIDPSHEQFSKAGELQIDPMHPKLNNNGDVLIQFEDGTKTIANNGQRSGLSQYYIFGKREQESLEHLRQELPEVKDLLNVIYSRADRPSDGEYVSENTQRAQAAVYFLIAKILNPEDTIIG